MYIMNIYIYICTYDEYIYIYYYDDDDDDDDDDEYIYIYTYICIYTYIYIHICIHVYMYIYIYTYIHMYTYYGDNDYYCDYYHYYYYYMLKWHTVCTETRIRLQTSALRSSAEASTIQWWCSMKASHARHGTSDSSFILGKNGRVEALRLGRLDTGTNRCNSLPEGRSSEYPSCNISSPGKENDVSWERSNIQSAFQQPPGSEALSGGVGEPPLVCAGAALGCWVRRQCWSPFSWWFHQANMGMKLVEAASTKDGIGICYHETFKPHSNTRNQKPTGIGPRSTINFTRNGDITARLQRDPWRVDGGVLLVKCDGTWSTWSAFGIVDVEVS